MCFDAMKWVARQDIGNPVGKLILMMIANYADEQGRCFPTKRTLAAASNCSISSVKIWLARFEEMGILTREEQFRANGSQTSNLFTLNFETSPKKDTIRVQDNAQDETVVFEKTRPGVNEKPTLNQSFNNQLYIDIIKEKNIKKEKSKILDEEFNMFWRLYQHKVGKPRAKIAFAKARKTAPLDDILNGLQRYNAAKPDWQQWLNPSTFLNQERFYDVPAQTRQKGIGRSVADKIAEIGANLSRDDQSYGNRISAAIQRWENTILSRD